GELRDGRGNFVDGRSLVAASDFVDLLGNARFDGTPESKNGIGLHGSSVRRGAAGSDAADERGASSQRGALARMNVANSNFIAAFSPNLTTDDALQGGQNAHRA
ncbi:hypothetical protein, partial [Achromobacter sp. GbtcB20]|uniref:hypothetical protein n=1 Tax=Achromobacter sp. GbtcB20 TaxID=2824765 RepID=UPI001C300143